MQADLLLPLRINSLRGDSKANDIGLQPVVLAVLSEWDPEFEGEGAGEHRKLRDIVIASTT